MLILELDGIGEVEVDEAFGRLPPDEQQRVANQIAQRIQADRNLPVPPQVPLGDNAGTEGRGLANIQQGVSTTARMLGFTGIADAVAPRPERLDGQGITERMSEDFTGNLTPGNVVGLIRENIADLGAVWASMKAGAAVGGLAGPAGAVVGGVLGPTLYVTARSLGPYAQEAARNNGREEPNFEDWSRAAAAVGVQGIAERLGFAGRGRGFLAGPRAMANEGSSEVIGDTAAGVATSVGTEAGLQLPTPSEAATSFTAGAGTRGAADVAGAAIRAPAQVTQAAVRGVADLTRRDEVRQMGDDQIASDLRVIQAYERRRAAEESFSSNTRVDPSVTFKGIMDDYDRAITGLADTLRESGRINQQQRDTIIAAIGEARRHNRNAAGEADPSYFETVRQRVAQAGLDPQVERAILNATRDLNTATYNSLYKNRRGPFEAMMGSFPAGGIVAGLGVAATGNPLAALAPVLLRGAARRTGAGLDRMAGTTQPEVLARSRVLQREAERRMIQEQPIAPQIRNLTNQARQQIQSNAQAAQQAQAAQAAQAAQYNAQANQLGLVRGGGWAPAIMTQASQIAPGIVDIEDPIRAVEDLSRLGALDPARANALINDRTARPTEPEMRLITDYVVTAATQAQRSSWNAPSASPGPATVAPNPPVTRVGNPAAYAPKMANVEALDEQIRATASTAGPEAFARAVAVMNAKSKEAKETAFGQGTGNPGLDALLRTAIDSTSARSRDPGPVRGSSTSVVGPEGQRARVSAARPGVSQETMGRDPTARVSLRAGARQGIQEDGRRAKVERGEGRNVLPAPQRWLGPDAKEGPFQGDRARPFKKGGEYLVKTPEGFEDITGTIPVSATIEVGEDGKPQMRVTNETGQLGDKYRDGPQVKTNLYKKKAGWQWLQEPSTGAPSTIVSTQDSKRHWYALRTDYDTPVLMARYEDLDSEPRLRPTAQGVVIPGKVVGRVWVPGKEGGKEHPVYDRLRVVSKQDPDAPKKAPKKAESPIAEAQASTEPLEGLPRKIKGLPFENGPHAPAREAAQAYMEDAGLPYNPPKKYVRILGDKADPGRQETSTRIAKAYDAAPVDNMDDPLVRASYDQMIKETLAQWQFMKRTGIKVEFNPEPNKDPYGDPWGAVRDVRENNHLYVFPTLEGFGTGETAGALTKDPDPMLQVVPGEDWGRGIPVTVNDIFRAVHDYFGHVKEGNGFRWDGEENAWRSHASMYSPLARLAMTTETRGQNSWLNFGPYGEQNRSATTEKTKFAPQKKAILPAWAHYVGAEDFLDPLSVADLRLKHTEPPPGADPDLWRERLGREKKAEEAQAKARELLNNGAKIPDAQLQGVSLIPDLQNLELGKTARTSRNGGVEVTKEILEPRREKAGVGVLNREDPADRKTMADILYFETLNHLANSRNALGWYDAKVKAMFRMASKVYPELEANDAAKAVFTTILAVTSNGVNVIDNYRLTFDHYSKIRDGVTKGDLKIPPTIKGVDKAGNMNATFKTWNKMVDEFKSPQELIAFMEADYRAGDLAKRVYETLGPTGKTKDGKDKKWAPSEEANTRIPGASVLGPKIGGGFWANLRGIYQYVTQDRWFVRTMARLEGRLYEHKGDDPATRARLATALTPDVVREFGLRNIDWSKASDDDLRAAAQKINTMDTSQGFPRSSKVVKSGRAGNGKLPVRSFTVKDERGRDQRKTEPAKDASGRVYTGEITKESHEARQVAKIITAGIKGAMIAQPQNKATRTQYRAIVDDVLARLERDGIKITAADLQAVIWFPEQQFWQRSMLVGSKKTDADYEDAVVMYLLRNGKEDVVREVYKEMGYSGTEIDALIDDRKAKAKQILKEKDDADEDTDEDDDE